MMGKALEHSKPAQSGKRKASEPASGLVTRKRKKEIEENTKMSLRSKSNGAAPKGKRSKH